MKFIQLFLMALVLVVMATGSSVAGKPTISEGIFNGNGFPSGPHYNLLLHGKKESYLCSPEKWVCSLDLSEFADQDSCQSSCSDPGVCEQAFGNVINMPYDDATGQILIESGRKGPKGASVDTLQVTDACAGFQIDDQASFQLPENEDGYALYVKIGGKPGEGTNASFAFPDFSYVEDEAGNDLILLGAVIGEELVQVDEDNIVVYRSEANSKGKGNKGPIATDLTPLFMYAGTTCYFNSTNDTGFDYCLDVNDDYVCTPHYICCQVIDGIYDNCTMPDLVDGSLACNIEGSDLITAECRDYSSDPQWIFNIADFVGMLWEVTNNGAYNIQLRFYPLPLNSQNI